MKKRSFILLVFSMFLILYSCDDELAPPPAEDMREEIARTWSCELNDGENTSTFESVITLDPDSDNQILISNFHGLDPDSAVYATVYEDKTITLPNQKLMGTNTIVEGTKVTISEGFERIDWEYNATDQAGTYAVTVVYTFSDVKK